MKIVLDYIPFATFLVKFKTMSLLRQQEVFFVFLSLVRVAVFQCPPTCRCSGTSADCSSLELNVSTIPIRFAADITKIKLNNNKLSSIPSGLFDTLQNLRSVSLDSNPWACDCSILYLRSWLLKQEDRSQYKNLRCFSPVELQGRLILYLTEDEVVSTCQDWYCNMAFVCQIMLFAFIVIQVILLILVIMFLRRFETFSKEAVRATKEDNFRNAM
ncbi:platelet glycoprotein Ib beta chain isoform X1 [Carcharodon carcharias]|uniref:platelet glycoprotein Ib beta chain isoform X1 n=2 Tax=Carcharodon carcharias TaxID=13397 RepID=UPI001B7D9768|nr:platelet glycoprotein Ib beta chain isoform X1 [Carcharodon carcharias]